MGLVVHSVPVTIILFFCFTQGLESARILAVLPHIGKSHFFVFEPYLKELASQGHEISVISHFPQEKPLPNYTDISIKGSSSVFKPTNGVNFNTFRLSSSHMFSNLYMNNLLGNMGTLTCEATLSHPSVQELLKSDERFDLVITELFVSECFLGFAHRFSAPHIALSSCLLMPWANHRFANPTNPAYIANTLGGLPDKMTFLERLENTVYFLYSELAFYLWQNRPSQEIAKKYFGDSMPSLAEIAQNTSLILVNSYRGLSRPRPLVPAVVEVGGIHVRAPKKLPKDLDRWMSEASHGVVYFSMGSMLRAETLPAAKLDALLAAFRELPQRVLWKWEGDTLPGQPDNVRIGKWLPQRDILNHPNVRLFITHCGMLSTIEAAQNGVPVVGIPIYGDQSTNYRDLEAAGVGVKLDFQSQFTKEEIVSAVRTVLDNKTYSENAKRLSSQFLDRPSSPIESAIFWTEYVIRHKGAQHLRSAAVHLAWYQYLLLDVMLAILAVILVTVGIATVVIKKLVRHFGGRDRKHKQQ